MWEFVFVASVVCIAAFGSVGIFWKFAFQPTAKTMLEEERQRQRLYYERLLEEECKNSEMLRGKLTATETMFMSTAAGALIRFHGVSHALNDMYNVVLRAMVRRDAGDAEMAMCEIAFFLHRKFGNELLDAEIAKARAQMEASGEIDPEIPNVDEESFVPTLPALPEHTINPN